MRVDAQFRHVIVIEHDLVVIAHLHDIHVRHQILDAAGAVAAARFRIKFTNNADGGYHIFERDPEIPGDSLEVAFINMVQMPGNDECGDGILHVELSKLNQQAFAQVARAHAGRVKTLDHLQSRFSLVAGHLEEF